MNHFNRLITIIIVIVLSLFAMFKPLGIDNDSYGYYFLIHHEDSSMKQLEYSFNQLVDALRLVGLNESLHTAVFGVYAFLTLFLMYVCISIETNQRPLLPYVFFMLMFYPLLVLTQIRFGLAVALMLLALQNVSCSKYYVSFSLLLLSAYVHVSMILLIPVVLFSNSKRFYFILLPIFYAVIFLIYGILSSSFSFVPGFLESKINIYLSEPIRNLTIFNSLSLFVFATIFCFLFARRYFDPCYTRVVIIFAVSYVIFFDTPTLSDRFLVLAGAVSIFTLAHPLVSTPNRFRSLAIFLCLLYAMAYCINDVYFNGLLHFIG